MNQDQKTKKDIVDNPLYEIICTLPSSFEEPFIDHLTLLNITDTWSEEIPGKKTITAHVYSSSLKEKNRILDSLSTFLSDSLPLTEKFILSWQVVAETDWLAEWKKNYTSLAIGKTLLVVPVWDAESSPEGKAKKIIIDPGMAFGTGNHPTTKLCLSFLEEVFLTAHNPPLSVLDLGCGSGILSIAAAKLGCDKVVGVDNDPVALENAKKNIRLNDVTIPLLLEIPTHQKFDLIVSNILSNTHIALKNTLLQCLHPDSGLLILSGILGKQSSAIEKIFSDEGLFLKKKEEVEGWVCLFYCGRGQ